MKKQKSILIILAIILLIFTSCSNKDKQTLKAPITITIWHYYTSTLQSIFEEMITEFNNTIGIEKGIVLQAEYQEDIDILTTKITDSSNQKIGAKELPDMIFAYTGTVLDLDNLGLIANLEPYFSKDELNQYIPAYIEEGRIGERNELKSFPVAKSTEIIYINNYEYSIFKNEVNSSDKYLHVSDEQLLTCEGILEVADIYYKWTDDKTPEVACDGKAFFGLDATPNFISIGARQLSGAPVTVQYNEPEFNLEEETAKKLWDFYYYGIISGRFAEIGRYRADDMKTGEIIAYAGSTGGARYFPEEVMKDANHTYKTELAVSKYPVFMEGKPVAIQQGAGISIIKTDESRQAAASEFLKWFTSPNQNVKFSIASGYSPVMKNEYVSDIEKEAFIELEKEDVVSQNIAMVLELASKQMNEYELSVDKEYIGSFNVRNMFGVTLSEYAKQGRSEFLSDIAAGGNYTDLINKYMDYNRFKAWYDQLQVEFNNMIE